MTIELNHTIIQAKDAQRSARFLSELLGLDAPMAVRRNSTHHHDIFLSCA